MWVAYALVSAALLGLYDVFKKKSLQGNAVIPVLLINTVICTLFFLPSIIGSMTGTIPPESSLYIPNGSTCCSGQVYVRRFSPSGFSAEAERKKALTSNPMYGSSCSSHLPCSEHAADFMTNTLWHLRALASTGFSCRDGTICIRPS